MPAQAADMADMMMADREMVCTWSIDEELFVGVTFT